MTSSTQEPDLATEGDIIKERWKILKKLGGGGFGEIYECLDLQTKDTLAIKLESSKLPKQVLRMEVSVLKKLQNTKHACKCYGYGRNDKYSYVAMTLQGKNLADIRRQMKNARFSLCTTLQLTLQILDAIESIHEIGFLHRDIKPSNFAMGGSQDTRRTVFMLDFGLARQYVLPDGSFQVRPPREVAGFRGTVRYASVNAHNNVEMGRHDDLWSAFYMIVEMVTSQLPWRRIKDKEEVGKIKQNYDHTQFLQQLPHEFKQFLVHIQQLDYFKKPDYEFLRCLIRDCMIRGKIFQSDPYDWEMSAAANTATTQSTVITSMDNNAERRNSVAVSAGTGPRLCIAKSSRQQTNNGEFQQTADEGLEKCSKVSPKEPTIKMKKSQLEIVENVDNPTSIGKSSYKHVSNVNGGKSEKSQNHRSTMPPISPRSAFNSNKEKKIDVKFSEEIETPRNACQSDLITQEKLQSSIVESQNRSGGGGGRRNRREPEPVNKPSRLPILVKSGSCELSNNKSIDGDHDQQSFTGNNNVHRNLDDQKLETAVNTTIDNPTYNLSGVKISSSNLPPKPLTSSQTNVGVVPNKTSKATVIIRSNFLQSIGGSVATHAVNDDQFDVSNAPDATKAVHLTQMSNQDCDDDDYDVNDNFSDHCELDELGESNRMKHESIREKSSISKDVKRSGTIINPTKTAFVESNEYSNNESVSKIVRSNHIYHHPTATSTAATEKSGSKFVERSNGRSSCSVFNRVSNQEEDSSNCKSKESHEFEMTISKAKTTSNNTSGYVSSPPSNVNQKSGREKSGIAGGQSFIGIGQSGDEKMIHSIMSHKPPKTVENQQQQRYKPSNKNSNGQDTSDMSLSKSVSNRRNISKSVSNHQQQQSLGKSGSNGSSGSSKQYYYEMRKVSSGSSNNTGSHHHHPFQNLNHIDNGVIVAANFHHNSSGFSSHHRDSNVILPSNNRSDLRLHTNSIRIFESNDKPTPKPRNHHRSQSQIHRGGDVIDGVISGSGDVLNPNNQNSGNSSTIRHKSAHHHHLSSSEFNEIFFDKCALRQRSSSRESISRYSTTNNNKKSSSSTNNLQQKPSVVSSSSNKHRSSQRHRSTSFNCTDCPHCISHGTKSCPHHYQKNNSNNLLGGVLTNSLTRSGSLGRNSKSDLNLSFNDMLESNFISHLPKNTIRTSKDHSSSQRLKSNNNNNNQSSSSPSQYLTRSSTKAIPQSPTILHDSPHVVRKSCSSSMSRSRSADIINQLVRHGKNLTSSSSHNHSNSHHHYRVPPSSAVTKSSSSKDKIVAYNKSSVPPSTTSTNNRHTYKKVRQEESLEDDNSHSVSISNITSATTNQYSSSFNPRPPPVSGKYRSTSGFRRRQYQPPNWLNGT